MSNTISTGYVGADQVRSDFFFKPNFELLNQALASRQGMYDTNLATMNKVKAKADEVNALEGYDKERWHQKRSEYDTEIDRLKSLYDGDLSKINTDLDQFITNVGKDFGIHGEATAISNRYASAMANFKELEELRTKDEITEGQFRMWHRNLRETAAEGIGKDSKNWKSWGKVTATKAIKPEEFMNDFLKNKEADLVHNGYKVERQAGKLVFVREGHDVITYESLMEEGKAAMGAAMERTGQLDADYKWHLERTGEKVTVAPIIDQLKKSKDELINMHKGLTTFRGEELQRLINQAAGRNIINVDGKEGPQTLRMKEEALKYLTNQLQALDQSLTNMEKVAADPKAVENYHINHWKDRTLERLVHPYAGSKSRDRYNLDINISDDIYAQYALDTQKMMIQHGLDIQKIQLEWDLNNPTVPVMEEKMEGIYVPNPSGETPEDITKYKKNLESNMDFAAIGLIESSLGVENELKRLVNAGEVSIQDMQRLLANPNEAARLILKSRNINPADLSSAEVDGNGNLVICRTGQVIPLNPNLDRAFVEQQLGTIKTQQRQIQVAQQRENEAMQRVINNGKYTQEERKILQEIAEGKRPMPESIPEGAVSDIQLYIWRKAAANGDIEAKKKLEKYTAGLNSNLYNRFNSDMRAELKASSGMPMSTTFTDQYLGTTQKERDVNGKVVKDYFGNVANLGNKVVYVKNPTTGRMESKTFEKFQAEMKALYDEEIDIVLQDVPMISTGNVPGVSSNGDSWGMNYVIVSKGTKQVLGATKLVIPTSQVSSTLLNQTINKPENQTTNLLLTGMTNGLERYQTGVLNSLTGKEHDVTINYDKDKGNRDKHDHRPASVTIDGRVYGYDDGVAQIQQLYRDAQLGRTLQENYVANRIVSYNGQNVPLYQVVKGIVDLASPYNDEEGRRVGGSLTKDQAMGVLTRYMSDAQAMNVLGLGVSPTATSDVQYTRVRGPQASYYQSQSRFNLTTE